MIVDAAVGTFEEIFTAKGMAEGMEKGARNISIENILCVLSMKADKINLSKKLIDNIKSIDDLNQLKNLFSLALSSDSVSAFAKESNL